MVIEVKVPKEIDLKIKSDKDLEGIIKRKIEMEIFKEIKGDIFLSMLFDKLLEESELTGGDVDEIDHKVKKGIMENLGWK
ncbi:MAG: hypothetical protein SVY15_00690 [Halobacteriota archaeon]|nr:hypothetical protein [Halobacteriota archaeon]